MDIASFVLDGLEKALELERELGVRSVEFDRSLLRVETQTPKVEAAKPQAGEPHAEEPRAEKVHQPKPYDFVFLHHQPLSADGEAMLAKIVAAMGRNLETAPLVTAVPLPKARIYVVLGALAMRKFFPAMNGAPGTWRRTDGGDEILITYTPEYILRFARQKEVVERTKREMWQVLKVVMQKSARSKK